ncbi:MAG: Pyridoxal-dependent decarboxylase, partial [Rhodospirillales bacterium]|nr:Pyridoxal-dependent decarboxylase [Rhodospirillales bacterium]
MLESASSDTRARATLLGTASLAADYLQARRDAPVVQELGDGALRSALAHYDFVAPRPAEQVAADLIDLLSRSAVHSDHPRYFG